MNKNLRLPQCLLIVVASLFATTSLQAEQLGDFSSGVFEFQQKLAKGGDAQAQYKLGTMYEMGHGVDKDMNQAIDWYNKSRAQGYKQASNRLTYLEIKKSGFDKNKHGQWLSQLKQSARGRDSASIQLLGQMHREGVGVKKNLKQALSLLKRASSMGHSEVDADVDAILTELDNREQEAKAKEQAKAKQASQQKQKKTAAKPSKQEAEKKRIAQDTARKDNARKEKARKQKLAELERRKRHARRLKLEQEKRRLEAERQHLEEEKRAAQKAAEAKAEADAGQCSGAAARFRTTCR